MKPRLALFKSKLSLRMFLNIMIAGLLMTLIFSVFRVAGEYNKERENLEESFRIIRDSNLPSIANSVFFINTELMETQLRGILQMEDMVYLKLTERRGEQEILYEFGRMTENAPLNRSYPLLYQSTLGEEHDLGTLEVQADLDLLIARVRNRTLKIGLELFMMIFFVSAIIFVLIELSVTRYLRQLASYADSFELNRAGETVELKRNGVDEFTVLTGAINNMSSRLHTEIEEKELLQQQYLQSQKLESVGRFAGSISHDLNNLLTPIFAYTQLLEGMIGEDEQGKNLSSGIMESAERARLLIRRLLTFSSSESMPLQTLDLDSLIRDFHRLLRGSISNNISLEYDLKSGGRLITGDPVQIEQILMNLAVNAADAMPSGGTIRISSSPCRIGRDFQNGLIPAEPGSYCCLTVGDTGYGMDQATLDKIFNPFYSTKGNKGTGLGLSSVMAILKRGKGTIRVNSEPGEGTSFRLYFPLSPESDEAGVSRGGHRDRIRGDESIMVVEDDPKVVDLISLILKEQGCRVRSFHDIDGACAYLEENSVDLILTDTALPDGTGLDLMKRIRLTGKTVPILLMSGATGEMISLSEDQRKLLLSKPFTRDELLQHIRKGLGHQ